MTRARNRGRNRGYAATNGFAVGYVSGFTTTDYLETANPGGPAGNGSGLVVAVALRFDSQAVSSTSRMIVSHGNSGTTAGYDIRTTGTNTTLVFGAADGGGVRRTLSSTITAGMIGKWLLIVMWYEPGSSLLRAAINGVEVGSGSAMTGFTAFSGRTRMGQLSSATTFTSDGISIHGIAGATGVVATVAEALAVYDAFRATRVLQVIPGKTDHLWRVSTAFAATLPNRVGSGDMTVAGAPAFAMDYRPDWV